MVVRLAVYCGPDWDPGVFLKYDLQVYLVTLKVRGV